MNIAGSGISLKNVAYPLFFPSRNEFNSPFSNLLISAFDIGSEINSFNILKLQAAQNSLTMHNRKKIFAICGSTKTDSTNELILKLLASWFTNEIDMHIYNGIAALPHFNPEITDEQLPNAVKEFRELVDGADGVIICTPEYVFSLPGSLKNAIEWTVSTTVFSHKPLALIVASASGEKAFEALKLIMSTIEGRVSEEASLLIRGAKGKFSKEGKVLDEQLEQNLKGVLTSLLKNIG